MATSQVSRSEDTNVHLLPLRQLASGEVSGPVSRRTVLSTFRHLFKRVCRRGLRNARACYLQPRDCGRFVVGLFRLTKRRRKMKRNHAYRTMLLGVSLACLLGWAPRRARGQAATTGAIVGTVTDTSGAVIADADVTITNVCTQQGRVVKTNSSGIFDAEA